MDWATAKTKAETPKPPQKSFREVLHQIAENAKDKKLLDEWAPYVLKNGEPGFEEDLAFLACTEYLQAWQSKNYGKMSRLLSNLVVSSRGNAMPKFVCDEYAACVLERFEIQALSHMAAAVCEIEATIQIADKEERTASLRWIYEGEGGKITMLPKGNGEWKLVNWGVNAFLR